jgi:hypothetical protein
MSHTQQGFAAKRIPSDGKCYKDLAWPAGLWSTPGASLSDINGFMRCLNEHVARHLANAKDFRRCLS